MSHSFMLSHAHRHSQVPSESLYRNNDKLDLKNFESRDEKLPICLTVWQAALHVLRYLRGTYDRGPRPAVCEGPFTQNWPYMS